MTKLYTGTHQGSFFPDHDVCKESSIFYRAFSLRIREMIEESELSNCRKQLCSASLSPIQGLFMY